MELTDSAMRQSLIDSGGDEYEEEREDGPTFEDIPIGYLADRDALDQLAALERLDGWRINGSWSDWIDAVAALIRSRRPHP